MGIKSLLPKFRAIESNISANDLSGETVGIDASTWLYSILMKYSVDLVRNIADASLYASDFCSAVDVLVKHNVTPIIVFDGKELLAKQRTKEERTRNRRQAKARTLQALASGDTSIANQMAIKLNADKAVAVTQEIIDNVIQALDKCNICWIQAPFEADAQLAYMAHAGVISHVISTDSDLLVYGTPRVIFKWNVHEGKGILLQFKHLHRCLEFDFSLEKFQIFCIITGCDYVPSLKGIGPCLAERYMVSVGNIDPIKEIHRFAHHVGRQRLEIWDTYADDVARALFVFRHQCVFDAGTQHSVPCTPVTYTAAPATYKAAAGITDADLTATPPCSHNLPTIWLPLEALDISDLSDVSWLQDSDDSNSSQNLEAPTLRSSLSVTIDYDGEFKLWVPPCLPVLKVPLQLFIDTQDRAIAVHLRDNPELPQQFPFTLNCSEHCNINVDGEEKLLLWKWNVSMDTSLHSEEGDEDEEEDEENTEEENSEPEGDDALVLDDENGDDGDDDDEEQELNFKVVGVTYGVRQNYIECAKELITNGVKVPVRLVPEPHNPVDPGGIAVEFDTGKEFGKVCVGYIPKEFKDCITTYLQNNKITCVKIHHIKLQMFNPIGLYILLKITKKGRWPLFVIRKSYNAR